MEGRGGKGAEGQGAEQGGESVPHRLCSECSAVGPPSNLDLTYRAGLLLAEAYTLFILLVIIYKTSSEACPDHLSLNTPNDSLQVL